MENRRTPSTPNGSIVIWLAGGVFSTSAALVLTYHFLLASHAAPPAVLDVAHAAASSEVGASNPAVASAHAEALKAASN